MAKANGMVIKVQPRQYSTSNFELEVLTESSFRKKTNIFSDDQIIISDYEIFFFLNTVAPTVQIGFKFKDIFFSFLLLKSLRYRIT